MENQMSWPLKNPGQTRSQSHSVKQFAEALGIGAAVMASAIRSWGEDVSRYKGRERYGEVLLEYLDRKHEEQLEAGLDVETEEMVRRYPY